MKVRFVRESVFGISLLGEFDVERKPTDREVQAIYQYIASAEDRWQEGKISDDDFDLNKICQRAAHKHLPLKKNRVVKTLYV